jgi:hypothetical protein
MKWIMAFLLAAVCVGLVKVRAANCNSGWEYSKTCYLLVGE